MEESPRFRFFSLTFLIGFGVGTFVGAALGLTAFLFVSSEPTEPVIQVSASPSPVSPTQPMATPVRSRTNSAMEVRIGPGTQYAALGTIARGEDVDIVGRDSMAEWVAVRFPPGSSAQAWLPVRAVDNISDLYGLAVVAPTPLPRAVSTTIPSSLAPNPQPTGITTDDGVGLSTSTPPPSVTGTPSASASVTPTVPVSGEPDLAVVRVSRLADGRVQVLIANRGTAHLEGFQVFAVVTDPTTRSEMLQSNGAGLRAGSSVVLESSRFTVDQPLTVTAVVDPSQSVPDADRSNNALTVMLEPPAISETPAR